MKRAYKMFVDFDKEETWLNEMAATGHLVAKAGLRYTFAPIDPGSVVVRIDYRPSMRAADFEDYRSLFWDAGWRHLAGSRGSGTQYFASTSGDASADIFSEARSKAQRYRRAMGEGMMILVPFLFVLVVLWPREITFDTFLSPGELYFTPGLWEMSGWEFTWRFLFETPFVALRAGGFSFLLVAVCLAMLVQVVYQAVLYRRALVTSRL